MQVPIVFISSTYEDLKPYRQAARDAANRCDFLPRMMEYFAAGPCPPLAECLAKVDGANLLVVIVAHCFGWVPDRQRVAKAKRKSITWLECEQALAAGLDVLAFLVDDGYAWPAELREEHRLAEAALANKLTAELAADIQWRVQRLKAFKSEICDPRIIARFTTPESLQLQMERALHDWRQRHPEFAAAPPAPAAPCDPTAYLKALDEDTAYINIRGIQVRSGQANRFPIDELYIPLTTTARGKETPGESESDLETLPGGTKRPDGIERAFGAGLSTPPKPPTSAFGAGLPTPPKPPTAGLLDVAEHVARHITLDQALQSRRLVIIGDPGAGKSTFLNRIAHRLCRARLDPAQRPVVSQQLGLDDAPFPVLVQLASLVEHIQTARGRNHGPTALDAPGWLVHYMASQCTENRHGLDERFFEALFANGDAILLLDGLDEAPTEALRENIARLIRRAAQAYPQCRWVVTSRPAAYHDAVVLDDFDHVHIDRLDDAAIETFLRRWYSALFPESPRLATHHGDQVLEALRDRPEIRLLARNPVMLTALGVVHWNEQRLPEQRAELYEAIVRWLSLSRKQKPGRLAPETTVNLLQELALQMQADPDGRQTQVNRHWAAQRVGAEYANRAAGDPVVWAEAFLEQEEIDSGIVVRRGDDLRFWHLTLQEFLAARAIAAREDDEQDQLLRSTRRGQRELRIYQPEWREMVLLLAGVLHHHGHRRVERMFGTILDLLPQDAALAEQARCAALLGAAVQDLAPLKYKPADARYQQLFDAVFGVFERERSARVPIRVAIEAAEALGQAGDPRLTGAQRERNWIAIQAGEFLMGSQRDDPGKPNYDPETYVGEGPVHTVWLDEFRIGRYPVTVAEFARFVVQGGYQDRRWWTAGGYSDQSSPDEWEEQLQHPNRPVVGVSWFEAAAYAAWAGCRLPTEAQWERAARGIEGRKYAWGNEEPADRRMNYAPGWPPNVGRPTPVGIYPLGATPEGICDLCGNVLEWCADWQGPYDDSMQRNPTGPSSGSFRVLRGGSWLDGPVVCRAAYRPLCEPVYRNVFIGLRLVVGGG